MYSFILGIVLLLLFRLVCTSMDHLSNAVAHCCAECGGEEGVVNLKVCKACMLVKYCNANCQRNHWPTHKKECKQRAAELRDEALFKDPKAKEECPICFLPMPFQLICCLSLPPATITSVPIYDFQEANEELSTKETAVCYECCGKDICGGCISSCVESGNYKCPFCKTMRMGKTDDEKIEELLKRVEVNDAGAIYVLGSYYSFEQLGLRQDREKTMELYAQAADLGHSQAHCELGNEYRLDGNLKKAKFHYEAAAMAGHEAARNNLGCMEEHVGNKERAVKHWKIAASAGCQNAMCALLIFYEQGLVSRDAIDTMG